MAEAKRERFGSRLGFILISAGCAIGLGNVWRFPYITGEYGGAAFVLMYLVFLVILGLPVMVMEFAVGRASQKSAAAAFDTLQPSRKWHWFSWWGYIGCMVLMMFYTTVGGWMLSFVVKMATGAFNGLDSAGVGEVFNAMLANPTELVGWMLVVIVLGFLVCSLGLQKGVERVTKVMMVCLLGIMVVLVVARRHAAGRPSRASSSTSSPTSGACSQARRRLSSGPRSATPCSRPWARRSSRCRSASRPWRYSAATSARNARSPARRCASAGWTRLWRSWPASSSSRRASRSRVEPGSGPGLVFVTLPSVFGQMPMGQLWGALFFVFMSFAALSTIIAVFENLISWSMDKWGWSRHTAVARTAVIVCVLSLPCALGFNVLAGVHDPGHRRHPVHRGLHRVEQPAAAGQPVLRAVLRVAWRLGLGQLPGRGRHRQGHPLPALVEALAEVRHPCADPGDLRDGLRAEVRRVAGDGVE